MADSKRPAKSLQLSLLEYNTDSAIIFLASGLVTYVSAVDEEWVNQEKWHACKAQNTEYERYYVRRCKWVKGVLKTLSLHREVMQHVLGRPMERGEVVDHIDSNPLNNRRANLRLATYSQNSQNQRIAAKNTSGYKGVSKWTYGPKWRAQIKVDNKIVHLGTFDTPEEAHEAYKEAAVKYFGEFARFE